MVNRLVVLLQHLLKWQCQPNLRGRSWQLTIAEQRTRLHAHLADNPSLAARLPDAAAQAYPLAVLAALRETGFDRAAFPPANPWTPDAILNEDFYPE